MDSTTLLYYLHRQHVGCVALSFDYGQKHFKELTFAQELTMELGIPHTVFDLADYRRLANSALTDSGIDVPEGHYTAESMKATVVPNRNMTMISIATALAVTTKADIVATGVHAGDHAIYPDCRPEFIFHLEQTLKIANEGFIHPDFQILAPWLMISKTQIANIGNELKVPWAKTWSCYKGGEKHCGVCGTCVERREALRDAGNGIDPTEYVNA
jgi:7-cyano-7-deazaguanine synthase